MEHSSFATPKGTSLAAGGIDFSTLQAKDVMQYGVLSVGEDEPVHKAIQLLLDKHISGLPVTRQGRLAGVLSEKDVLRLLYEREYLPGAVGDYMSRDIVTFDVEDNFSEICECLMKSTYRRVPILHEGKLAGMITRADLIRIYKEHFRSPTATAAAARSREELLAGDAMTRGLLTVPQDATLYDVMDTLSTQHVTGLPVADEAMHLQGIITEKDVLRCIGDLQTRDPKVRDYMTRNVVTFDQTARLSEVCECLIRHNFRRVPILSHDRLVGIVGRADIIRKMSAVFKGRPTSHNN